MKMDRKTILWNVFACLASHQRKSRIQSCMYGSCCAGLESVNTEKGHIECVCDKGDAREVEAEAHVKQTKIETRRRRLPHGAAPGDLGLLRVLAPRRSVGSEIHRTWSSL